MHGCKRTAAASSLTLPPALRDLGGRLELALVCLVCRVSLVTVKHPVEAVLLNTEDG